MNWKIDKSINEVYCSVFRNIFFCVYCDVFEYVSKNLNQIYFTNSINAIIREDLYGIQNNNSRQ
jgi:hypothetical protein